MIEADKIILFFNNNTRCVVCDALITGTVFRSLFHDGILCKDCLNQALEYSTCLEDFDLTTELDESTKEVFVTITKAPGYKSPKPWTFVIKLTNPDLTYNTGFYVFTCNRRKYHFIFSYCGTNIPNFELTLFRELYDGTIEDTNYYREIELYKKPKSALDAWVLESFNI